MLKKRILASSMASVMALTSISAVAFAADEEKYGNKTVADLKAYIESDEIKKFVGSSDYNATQTTNFNNAYKYAQNVVNKNLTGEATVAYREMAAVAKAMKHYTAEELMDLVKKTETELGENNKLPGGDGQDLVFADSAYTNAKAKARTGRTVAENNKNEYRRIDNAYDDLLNAYNNLLANRLQVISKSDFKAIYDKVDSLIQNNKLKYDAWARVKIDGSISGYNGYTASYGVFYKHMTDVFNKITETYKLFSAKTVDITTNADIRAAFSATEQAYAVLNVVINNNSFVGETFAYESDVQSLIGKDGQFRTRLAYDFAAADASADVPTLLASAIAAVGNKAGGSTTTYSKVTTYTVNAGTVGSSTTTAPTGVSIKDAASAVTSPVSADKPELSAFGASYAANGGTKTESSDVAVTASGPSDVAGVNPIVIWYQWDSDADGAADTYVSVTYKLQESVAADSTGTTVNAKLLQFNKNAAFASRDEEWADVTSDMDGAKGSVVDGVDGVWSVNMNGGKIGEAKLVVKFGAKAQAVYDANGFITRFAADGASVSLSAGEEKVLPVGVGEVFDLSNLANISDNLIAVTAGDSDAVEANGVIDGDQTSDYHCGTTPLVFGHRHDGGDGAIYGAITSYTDTMGEAYDGTAANTKVALDKILSIAQNYLNGKTATNGEGVANGLLTKAIDTNGSYLTQLVKNPELAATNASGIRQNGIITEEWSDIYNYLNYALNDKYGTPSVDATLKTRSDVAALIADMKSLEAKTYNVPMFTNEYKDAVAARQDAEKWYSMTNNYAYEDNNENGTQPVKDAAFFTSAGSPKVDLVTGVNANTLYGDYNNGLYYYYRVLKEINDKYSLSFGTIADLITSASAKYDEKGDDALKVAIDNCAFALSVVKSNQNGADYNAFTNSREFQASNRINTDAGSNSVSEKALVDAYNALVKAMSGIKGDVDGSGKVNVSDVTALLTHIIKKDYGEKGSEVFEICDVNDDGYVNVKDATAILQIIVDAKKG